MATRYSILPNYPVHRVATTPHPADGYRAIIAGQAQRRPAKQCALIHSPTAERANARNGNLSYRFAFTSNNLAS